MGSWKWIVLWAVCLLVACRSEPQEIQVTRLATQVVTREVVQEVTRLVERVITATPEPATPTPALVEVAPDLDQVGFPKGYQDGYTLFYPFDRPDNRSARVVYANAAAASVVSGEPFPFGSVLVMDVFRTQRDEADNVLLDDSGRYVRDDLFGLSAMRKEPGYGGKYGVLRNGEWEYMAYRPDGSPLFPPDRTTSCAACPVEAGQGKDWVIATHRYFAGGMSPPPAAPAENSVNIVDYTLFPSTLTATDGAINSGALRPGASPA